MGICKANGYIQPTAYEGIYNALHRSAISLRELRTSIDGSLIFIPAEASSQSFSHVSESSVSASTSSMLVSKRNHLDCWIGNRQSLICAFSGWRLLYWQVPEERRRSRTWNSVRSLQASGPGICCIDFTSINSTHLNSNQNYRKRYALKSLRLYLLSITPRISDRLSLVTRI